VTFTITQASGQVTTGTAATGSNGIAVYKLKLTKNSSAGTYQVDAAATIKGMPRNATTNFTVQ
jgi:hypothetical protein